MKIAFLSDAHGNSIALQQCLEKIFQQGVDQIWFLGDAIGYYPDFNGVIDLLQQNGVSCLLGNHEAMLLHYIPLDKEKDVVYGIEKNRDSISSDNFEFLRKLLPYSILNTGDLKLLCVHGGPFNPLEEYVSNNYDFDRLSKLEYDFIFCGHTHWAFHKAFAEKQYINVGSCGLPRDIGNMGSYVLLDTVTKKIEVLRYTLDVERILERYHGKTHESVLQVLNRNNK